VLLVTHDAEKALHLADERARLDQITALP